MNSGRPENSCGKVYLVGAGPGDPDLLTKRAYELMQSCEIIAYDALISPSILSLCSPFSELISVGYRGYGSKRLGYRIHPKIIESALKGKSILRLKSGDPLIFGRASQECEELSENGISFEIIPGITSAVAAAAYTGIPLTHRNYSSDLIITSGHDLVGGSPSNSNWEALGKSTGTIAIYMAATKIRENCERLIQTGRDPKTPAAFISNATRGSQKIKIGTLSNLEEIVGPIDKGVPALILAGETVGLYEKLDWFNNKPFYNEAVLVARARRGPSTISNLLRFQGAEVIEAPWILVDPLDSFSLEQTIVDLHVYQHLLFTCEDGVDSFFHHLLSSGRDIRKFSGIQISALGFSVSQRLEKFAVLADTVFEGHCFDAIQRKKSILNSGRILAITSNRGRPSLQRTFEKLGIVVDWCSTYKISHQFPNISPPLVNYVILPSSTSARILFEGPWGQALQKTPMVCLGPETTEVATCFGAREILMTSRDQPEAVVELLRQRKGL